MTFKDHFSGRASQYSRFRPDYPDALFTWLGGVTPKHESVWDCGTGSGQAAKALTAIFRSVIATDASAEQLENAVPHPRIEYRVAAASASGLSDESVNMVTVAQALHWFDFQSFYAEVHRVLTADGALVVWGYGDPVMETASIEHIVHQFNRGTIEKYWSPEREMVLDGYASIPFPFREIETPSLWIERRWTLGELAGYMRTWSATASYVRANGIDPVNSVEQELEGEWGGNENRRLVRWPLRIRAGYI